MNKKGGLFSVLLFIIIIAVVSILVYKIIIDQEGIDEDLSFFCEKHGYKNYTSSPFVNYNCFNINNGYIDRVEVSRINGEFGIEDEKKRIKKSIR